MVAHVIEEPEKAADDTAWVSWKKRIGLRKRRKNAEKEGALLMEVKETAACGISEREFAIELEAGEVQEIYRVFLFAQDGSGFYDEDFLEDLKSQMSFIIGPSLDEDPSEDTTEKGIHWEDTGSSYNVAFNETGARKLYQILLAIEHPGEGLDKEFSQKLLDQMMEKASEALDA